MQDEITIPKKNLIALFCLVIIAIANFLEPERIGLRVLFISMLAVIVYIGLRWLLGELKKRIL